MAEDLGRLEIEVGLKSTIQEDAQAMRAQAQGAVQQVAQGIQTGGAGRGFQSSGAAQISTIGGSYNTVAGPAHANTPLGMDYRFVPRPFSEASYRAGVEERFFGATAVRTGRGQARLTAEQIQAYSEAVSPHRIAEARAEFGASERLRTQFEINQANVTARERMRRDLELHPTLETRRRVETAQERHEQFYAQEGIRAETAQERHESYYARRRTTDENTQARHEQYTDRQRQRGEDQQRTRENQYDRDRINTENRQARHERTYDADRIRSEDRQHRQEGGYEREFISAERGYRRATLEERISQTYRRGARARILETEAGMLWGGGGGGGGLPPVPGTPEEFDRAAEAARLRGRAQRERQQGFLGRGSPRMIFMQAIFGAWELGRAMQGAGLVMSPASGDLTQMQQQATGIGMIGSGIFGGAALGALNQIDIMQMMAGRNMQRGGFLGNYSPMGLRIAQQAAEAGIGQVTANTRGYAQELQILGRIRNSSHYQQLQEEGRILKEEQADLATHGGTPEQVADFEARRRTWQRTYDERLGYANRQDVTEVRQANLQNEAVDMRLKGYGGEAARLGVEAQFVPHRDAGGKIVAYGTLMKGQRGFEQVEAAYRLAMKEAGIIEERAGIAAQGTVSALNLQAMGRPISAQKDVALTQFGMARVGLDANSPDFWRAINKYVATTQAIDAQADRQRHLIGLSIGTEAAQLGVLLDPSIGLRTGGLMAQTIGAAGGAISTATQLSQQELLTKEMRAQLVSNAVGQQRLAARQYAEGFRGVQFDLATSVISPRDQADPSKVFGQIDDNVKKIEQTISGLHVYQ